jgi:alpha-tubulin suppressor-like RCC1 family protein
MDISPNMVSFHLSLINSIELRSLSVGEHHCAAIDDKGRCFMWGKNTFGECGVDPEITKIVSPPEILKFNTILPPESVQQKLIPNQTEPPPSKVL